MSPVLLRTSKAFYNKGTDSQNNEVLSNIPLSSEILYLSSYHMSLLSKKGDQFIESRWNSDNHCGHTELSM